MDEIGWQCVVELVSQPVSNACCGFAGNIAALNWQLQRFVPKKDSFGRIQLLHSFLPTICLDLTEEQDT